MPREFKRSDRIASQLQRELSELLRSHVHDAALGMVTVNGVDVTRDISVAKIYVSFLGASDTPKKCVKVLDRLVPMLRHEIGKRMRMRVLPALRFVYDESFERGMQIQALLQSVGNSGDTCLNDSDEDA
jgi:ribosome-binding factor A